jgi:hypothetical protein
MPQTTGTRVNIDAGKVTGVETEKGTIRASSRPQVRAGLSSASACPAAGHTVRANQGVLRFAPAMHALPGGSLLDRSRFPLSERIDSQPSTGWRLQQRRYHRHAVAQQHHRRLSKLLQKLLELRDDAEYYSSVRGFSVQSLIKNCWLARLATMPALASLARAVGEWRLNTLFGPELIWQVCRQACVYRHNLHHPRARSYASDSDRVGTSQRTAALCQSRLNAMQQISTGLSSILKSLVGGRRSRAAAP